MERRWAKGTYTLLDIPVGQDTELTPCISPAHLSAPHIKFEAETTAPRHHINEDHVINFAMGYFLQIQHYCVICHGDAQGFTKPPKVRDF